MAKLFATERAQEVIDAAVQLHGGDGVRRGHVGRAPLPRDPRAAHLRGRLGRAEGGHRAPDARLPGELTCSERPPTPTASPATTCPRPKRGRSSTSPASTTPTAQRRGRADRPHGREGLRRQRRADRQRPAAHLQGARRLDQPHRPRAGRGLWARARQPRADPLGQQPGDGRRLARAPPRRRRRRQHHADAAGGRARQDRRQGRNRLRPLRHPHQGRAVACAKEAASSRPWSASTAPPTTTPSSTASR